MGFLMYCLVVFFRVLFYDFNCWIKFFEKKVYEEFNFLFGLFGNFVVSGCIVDELVLYFIWVEGVGDILVVIIKMEE